RNRPVVEPDLARALDDVGHLLGLVLHRRGERARREDRVPERGAVPLNTVLGDEPSAPAPLRQLGRPHARGRDHRLRNPPPPSRILVPSSTIHIVASRKTPSRCREQTFWPPGYAL